METDRWRKGDRRSEKTTERIQVMRQDVCESEFDSKGSNKRNKRKEKKKKGNWRFSSERTHKIGPQSEAGNRTS